MSILTAKTAIKAIHIIKRALKILDKIPADVAMTRDDDFELSLARNMLKSIIEHNTTVISIGEEQR